MKRSEADTGAVTLIQRFGSAANLNTHLHCLVLDGVYRDSEGGLDGGRLRRHSPRAPGGSQCPGRSISKVKTSPKSWMVARECAS